MNIPDGEVFTAPVRDSVEGHVRFNTPTIYQGTSFDGVRLEFADGRIVEADCAGGDVDEAPADLRHRTRGPATSASGRSAATRGSCTRCATSSSTRRSPAASTSRPGNAYDEADNGNRSKIHWDLVQIQRPEYGGGTIAFDGEPIRVDGRFVPEDLQALNP